MISLSSKFRCKIANMLLYLLMPVKLATRDTAALGPERIAVKCYWYNPEIIAVYRISRLPGKLSQTLGRGLRIQNWTEIQLRGVTNTSKVGLLWPAAKLSRQHRRATKKHHPLLYGGAQYVYWLPGYKLFVRSGRRSSWLFMRLIDSRSWKRF